MKREGTLNVRNTAQLLALKCEMLGQISDGQWENSSPFDHWQAWCSCEIKVDPSNVGHDFYARKESYNFVNGELLEIVGERMLFQVKLGLLIADAAPDFLETYCDYHHSFPDGLSDFFDTKKYAVSSDGGSDYWKTQLAGWEAMGIDEYLIHDVEKWDGYTMKDLKADLRDLKVIFKTRNNR